MQMSLDKSVEHLVAVVYDWSGTEETGGEPAILATARVPFSGLCRILLCMWREAAELATCLIIEKVLVLV